MIKKPIILAAACGTRWQPLTDDLPMPRIPLLGKPVMESIVEHLARQGIREIMVNTSHLAQRLEPCLKDGRRTCRWGDARRRPAAARSAA